MAKKENRYIRFYTPGSVAVKVQVQHEDTWAPLPEQKPQKKLIIPVDPVAILGFAVAVCMLILMAVGITQLNQARREVVTLERYVAQLTAEKHELEEAYAEGYKLERVHQQALDMGMIPVEEVPVNQIYVTMPIVEIVEEQTLWSRVTTFMTSLFA